ncbi:CDP-glucose 4,6-dehydratase [Qipengyuania spongiae]|uniref:CDP-glucose 4,6-dehydratase n=1 Tax=Qipengyuania spongiae TaxID=2909673 RepID=A0ABY5T411_9SPHN|nr:CDP-glucose 4,6-dehydratase [Qipengyuania spongiae]
MTGAVNAEFWAGKRVFLTGHTGFKGSWLTLWLSAMGAEVYGYAFDPGDAPNLFDLVDAGRGITSTTGDIRDLASVRTSMAVAEPNILIHMAAQSLVRPSYDDPVNTYATNVMGTVNVLEAARACPSLRAAVVVTTDKCYENREWEWGYREDEAMGGHDPYSSSKGCAELVSSAYRNSFFSSAPNGLNLATARAGNVIGGGDWARDRLVPDALCAFAEGKRVAIRNPLATRPWQHVLEPLSGYLVLTQALWRKGSDFAEGWNFGPRDEDARPVRWVVEELATHWGGDAGWVEADGFHPHEAHSLKLDISKARARLHWRPRWALEETVARIVAWQKAWLDGADMRAHCLTEIEAYTTEPTASEETIQ